MTYKEIMEIFEEGADFLNEEAIPRIFHLTDIIAEEDCDIDDWAILKQDADDVMTTVVLLRCHAYYMQMLSSVEFKDKKSEFKAVSIGIMSIDNTLLLHMDCVVKDLSSNNEICDVRIYNLRQELLEVYRTMEKKIKEIFHID